MGYTKIVQYGDTIEIYSYEKEIKKRGFDRLQAQRAYDRVYKGVRNTKTSSLLTVKEKRRKDRRNLALKQGFYTRSAASIRRSKLNFFRLCHHNNCLAKTIHFITLTFAYDVTIKEATRNVQGFMARVAKIRGQIAPYISVAELTKKDRIHFHLLVYDLPPETVKNERNTRNFQRQWRRGYVDIRYASYTSKGIAGYMAKYMGKALGNAKLATKRGYTSSRNIDKIRVAGGNTLSSHLDEIVFPHDEVDEITESSYNIPYLGVCQYKRIKKKK